MRDRLAITVGRIAGRLSRLRGGGATSLPGVAALKVSPKLIGSLAHELAGTIVVTGTNGKTTTSRFVRSILEADGRAVVHNQAGSNLLRGIASSLLLGRPPRKTANQTWGLFEVDEATVPEACRQLRPTVVVVTNLFRDQLDRYGELHRTAEYLRDGLKTLPKESIVLLNADDPLVASLGAGLDCRVVYFGIEDASASRGQLSHAADSLTDPKTGELLEYSAVFLGHLGHYTSTSGKLQRPKPQYALTKVGLRGIVGSDIEVRTPSETVSLSLKIPGLYNAYNALAAVSAGIALGVSTATITQAIGDTAAAFGRNERVRANDKDLFIGLIKNPTGANEVIHTLALESGAKDLLILINDNFADGRDVSWLWDADFDELVPQLRSVTVGGLRADDMAVRMKYAGVAEDRVTVERAVPAALKRALAGVPPKGTLFVLPTYTAMLDLRQELRRTGFVKHYLE